MATIDSIPEVFEALKKFINAKPNLERANYGLAPGQTPDRKQWWEARKDYEQELRGISKDGTRARKALAEALTYPPNPQALADAFRSAFSGRLSWSGTELEYCTGQYYPTEYRAAAATVLEYYCHAVRPKFTPAPGQSFTRISDIESASQRAGSHWFDASTKRFFSSRVLPRVFQGAGGIYFVSSEKGPNDVRRYTVRQFHPEDADITTLGEFNVLSRERALRIARIASEYPDAAREALGLVKETNMAQLKTDKLDVSVYARHGDTCGLAPHCKSLGCASGFEPDDYVLSARFAYLQEAIDYCEQVSGRGVSMRLVSRICSGKPHASEYPKNPKADTEAVNPLVFAAVLARQ